MDNFFYGLQSISISFLESLRRITKYELFWGFVLGFCVSTLVHAFVVSDHPKNIPRMVFQDASKSFQKIHKPKKGGTYQDSFSVYIEKVAKLKFVFLLCGILILFSLLLIFFL